MRRKLLAVMTCVAVLGMGYSGGVFALSDESYDDFSGEPGYITPCENYIDPGETPYPTLTPVEPTTTEQPTLVPVTPTPTPTEPYTPPDHCS